MFEMLFGLLSWLHTFSGPLAWVVVGVFLLGFLSERLSPRVTRSVYAGAWLVFGFYWLTMVHHLWFDKQSAIQTVAAAAAVPLAGVVAARILRGRDALFVLSRAVAFMGLFYLPFLAVPELRRPLILMVTDQTAWAMDALGYDPTVIEGTYIDPAVVDAPNLPEGRPISGKEDPWANTFVFWTDEHFFTYTIILACTGIGSMAIFVGLIAAVDAPIRDKLRGIALAVGIIYVLNIARNVFIAVAYGWQKMHLFPDLTKAIFGLQFDLRVSYIWADRIVAQSLSVVALVLITVLVVRAVPQVLDVIEELLYLLTGSEYDLQSAFGMEEPTTAGAD